jgi:hypothetical protein
VSWHRWLQSLFRGGSNAAVPSPRRLDRRSKPGWITNKEAKSLFSPMDDQYAFGEMDEVGKQNIASFAASIGDGCLFEFMPVEERVYFIRKRTDAS